MFQSPSEERGGGRSLTLKQRRTNNEDNDEEPTTMTAKRKKQERRTKNEGNTGWDLRLLRLPFTNVFTNVFNNPFTSTFTTTRAYPGHIQDISRAHPILSNPIKTQKQRRGYYYRFIKGTPHLTQTPYLSIHLAIQQGRTDNRQPTVRTRLAGQAIKQTKPNQTVTRDS